MKIRLLFALLLSLTLPPACTHFSGPLVEGCEVRDAGDDSWSVTWDGNYVISGIYGNNRRITLADNRDAPLQSGIPTLSLDWNEEYKQTLMEKKRHSFTNRLVRELRLSESKENRSKHPIN
jgi:hypothetical protein